MCLRNHSYAWIQYFVRTCSLKSIWSITSIYWLHLFDLVSWQSDVQMMKSKHTSLWIIQIKLKCFCWKEKLFLGQEKRKYIDNWIDFSWENKISEFYLKNKQSKIFMNVKLNVSLRKNTSEIRVEFLVFFNFFINFFMQTRA